MSEAEKTFKTEAEWRAIEGDYPSRIDWLSAWSKTLTKRQKDWITAKCVWEGMPRLAVLWDFGVPDHEQLDDSDHTFMGLDNLRKAMQ